MVKCIDPRLRLTNWDYCPSLLPPMIFSIFYGITTAIHIIQAIQYRSPYLWVLIMGGIWLAAAYIIRCFAVMHQESDGLFDSQYILILISPLWINAFAYMVLGRMIDAFMPEKEVIGIKARRCAVIFVSFDIFSFLIQVIGAITTVTHNPKVWHAGIRVYTAGVGFQFLVICAFLVVAVHFQKRVKLLPLPAGSGHEPLILSLYFSLGLIMLRIVFRVIEFSSGRGTPLSAQIALHEWYGFVFDGVPMFLAMVGWNFKHPGKILKGFETSSRGVRFWRGARDAEKNSNGNRGEILEKSASEGDNIVEVV